jgi:hypothetical protein
MAVQPDEAPDPRLTMRPASGVSEPPCPAGLGPRSALDGRAGVGCVLVTDAAWLIPLAANALRTRLVAPRVAESA